MSRDKLEVQYSSLPEEVLIHIFSYLPVEALLVLSLVNQQTRFMAKDNVLWNMIFAYYFPNLVNRLACQSNINWYEQFRDTYIHEIKLWSIKNLQEIAKAIIKRDIASLETIVPSLDILDNVNSEGSSLWDLAKKMGNQSVLDYLYQRKKTTYIVQQDDVLKISDLNGRRLIYWLVFCNQGANEFASLNQIAPIAELLDTPCSTRVSDKPIHMAAKEGRLCLVKKILTAKPDLLESTDANNQTPLLCAASNGHIEVVRFLIELRANVNQRSNNGMTILDWAAQAGHEKIVKLLLDNGAQVNAITIIHAVQGDLFFLVQEILAANPHFLESVDENKNTALSWAAVKGYTEVARFLISRGANVNQQSNTGMTPLHWAAKGGHKEIVNLLLENDAQVSIETEDNEHVLHCAVEGGLVELVTLILEQNSALVHATTTSEGLQPLHYAAIEGRIDILMALLNAGANIEAKTLNHLQPLFLAMVCNRVEAARKLIEMGAELDDVLFFEKDNELNRSESQFIFGNSNVKYRSLGLNVNLVGKKSEVSNLMELIVALGHVDILKIILEKKPDLLNEPIVFKKNILLAFRAEQANMTLYLLRYYSDFDADTKNKLLLMAVNINCAALVELLLEQGADPSAQFDNHHNIIHYIADMRKTVLSSDHIKIVHILHKKYPDLLCCRDQWEQTALHYAAKNGNTEFVAYFLENQPDLVDCASQVEGLFNGFTALHWAADLGEEETVALLLKANASHNIQSKGRLFLPVHRAAIHGHIGVMRRLIALDPQVITQKNNKGFTPLFYLAKYCEKNSFGNTKDEKFSGRHHLFLNQLVHDHVSQLESPEEIGLFLYDFFSQLYPFLLRKNETLSCNIIACFDSVDDINLIQNENGDTLLHFLIKKWTDIERNTFTDSVVFTDNFIIPLMEKGARPTAVNKDGYSVSDISNSMVVTRMLEYALKVIEYDDDLSVEMLKTELLQEEICELNFKNYKLALMNKQLQAELEKSSCGKRKSPERSSEQVKDEIKQAKKARVSDAVVSPLENFGLFQSDIRKDENEESQEKVREEKNDENGFKKN